MKVSHDFAVNFDEDNPECAGELSNTLDSFTHRQFHIHTSRDQNNSPVSVQRASHLFLAVSPAFLPLYLSPTFSSSHTHTNMHRHAHTLKHHRQSWEICRYAAESISGSKRQGKTTLICMCEMGFCALIPTYLCSCCEGFYVCVVYVNEKCTVTLDCNHQRRV